MRSPRFLALLLLVLALDFALPYEVTPRGWYEFEDEEESIHPDARRLERPRATGQEPASTATSVIIRPRPVPTPPGVRTPFVPLVSRLARADTSSPPASPDAP